MKTTVTLECLRLLSEAEAVFSAPGSLLRLRRLYLRAHGILPPPQLWVGRNLLLQNKGKVVLGDRCALGDNVSVVNHSRIMIGDDFLGASGLTIHSGTHDPSTLLPLAGPVIIGNRVWCGVNVTIVGPVTIGDDVVIAAGSVVVKDIEPNSISGGVPAKKLKSLERDPNQPLWSWNT